jgi:hypothetical protein
MYEGGWRPWIFACLWLTEPSRSARTHPAEHGLSALMRFLSVLNLRFKERDEVEVLVCEEAGNGILSFAALLQRCTLRLVRKASLLRKKKAKG